MSEPPISEAPRAVVPADEGAIREAAAILRDGRLVAFPTETVYGLGANATDDRAVAEIFAAKGRPRFNPLIVHVAGLAQAADHVSLGDLAHRLAARFWPGPLTLILPRKPDCRISLLCSAGLDSLGLRAPAHPVAQALIEACGLPLAAPSANASGRISPTTAAHVAEDLGDQVALILDGGPCPIGIESTVLDLTGERPLLLRPGAVTRDEIEALAGPVAAEGALEPGAAPRSPGQLESHYAPRLPLRLDANRARPDEALLAFGAVVAEGAAVTVNLSPAGNLREAAARLFAALHDLDRPGLTAIAVMPIPDRGLGQAINDRLRRAAAPRPGPRTPEALD